MNFLAKRFVAGETADEAIATIEKYQEYGLKFSLDLLGEDVANELEASKASQSYRMLLDDIEAKKLDSGISIKLTQMGLDIGDEFCLEEVRKVISHASEKNNFVRVDMEGSKYTERTIRVYKKLFEEFGSTVGLVLQAYLMRSEKDVKELASMKAPIRVCKGAYKESPSVAYQAMNNIRDQYKMMVQTLIEKGSKVAVATHDKLLVDWMIDYVQKENIDRDQFEFQFLYGLRRKLSVDLSNEGYRVRIYVPFGTHWFPYFSRRLRERKENILFVLKGLFAD